MNVYLSEGSLVNIGLCLFGYLVAIGLYLIKIRIDLTQAKIQTESLVETLKKVVWDFEQDRQAAKVQANATEHRLTVLEAKT